MNWGEFKLGLNLGEFCMNWVERVELELIGGELDCIWLNWVVLYFNFSCID